MANKKLLPATKTKTLPVVSDNNLSAYLNFVNTLPVLSLEQEQELARRYKYKKRSRCCTATCVITFTLCY